VKLTICKALALAMAFTLVDCASQKTVKEVDAEVKSEPVHTQPNELANKGYSAVEQSANLNPEQKIKIKALIDRAHEESQRLTDEDSQIKGVLIETMTTTPYNPSKVMELKHRLTKNSRAKIKNTMHALNEQPGQPRELE
jgi:hypothetical protein